tara:strand:- start:1773 stop:2039 length:267 start_codon:yes stop_codon:yes gene_type:complete
MGYKFYKMKKLILALVFVASLSMMSFTLINETEDENEVFEEVGRKCVDEAMLWVQQAIDYGLGDGELNGEYFSTYMNIYMSHYEECME